jgi:hypothetical protein
MNQEDAASLENYPHGRGYGHDYMRGGEVLGGYGYADRDEYEKPRGELMGQSQEMAVSTDAPGQPASDDSDS